MRTDSVGNACSDVEPGAGEGRRWRPSLLILRMLSPHLGPPTRSRAAVVDMGIAVRILRLSACCRCCPRAVSFMHDQLG
jgi:hypothetical protein